MVCFWSGFQVICFTLWAVYQLEIILFKGWQEFAQYGFFMKLWMILIVCCFFIFKCATSCALVCFRGFPTNVTDKNDAKWSRTRFQQRLAVLKGAKNGEL